MKRLLYSLSAFLLLTACQNDIDLTGHWHLFPIDNSKRIIIDGEYEIINIRNDSSTTFGQLFYGNYGIGGGYISNFFEKKFRFGGECLLLDFDFYTQKDTLYLNQTDYNDKDEKIYIAHYKAYKCEEGCCNKEMEMFQYLKVNVELPIVIDTNNTINYENITSYHQDIIYGFPKKRFNSYGTVPVLSLGDKISSPYDIPIWIEKNKLRIREEFHKKITITYFADKNTDLATIKGSLKIFKELGYEKVYFALRGESVQKDFKIWLKPFDLSNLEEWNKSNDFKTVEDWLNIN